MGRPLATSRLILRPSRWRDAPFLASLTGNGDVRRYLGGSVPLARRLGAAMSICRGPARDGSWIVTLQRMPIGYITLSAHKDGVDLELSYQFSPTVWGHGYASEAGRAICDYALGDLGLTRVIAETQAANAASCRLLERLGMRPMTRLSRFGADQIIFATSHEEWRVTI